MALSFIFGRWVCDGFDGGWSGRMRMWLAILGVFGYNFMIDWASSDGSVVETFD